MAVLAETEAFAASLSLAERLGELPADLADDALRAAALTAARESFDADRAAIRARFDEGRDGAGAACVRDGAAALDALIAALHDFAATRVFPAANPTLAERLAIAAVGGYGRAEIAPFSDVDLLFLLPYKRSARTEQLIEWLLYMLWDLGLKVGHAVRSVDECLRQAKADMTIRTNLLETRFLAGERALFVELRRRYAREVQVGDGADFVEAKLAERDARHRRAVDSRYLLEPNLKEGKGGMRDLHTLRWIAEYLYRVDRPEGWIARGVLSEDEARRFEKANAFLQTARCHLHYLTGRAEDRLTFDVQPEMARRMGYTDHAGSSSVERFMKHYSLTAKDVGDLTRIFCAHLEAQRKRPSRFSLRRLVFERRPVDGFRLDGERLNVPHERHFRGAPLDMIRIFRVAQRRGIDVHPEALRLIAQNLKAIGPQMRQNPDANRLFVEILTGPDPETHLRRMSEAGVLGRFLPDFGRVVAQMQYDMYHVFTVDEHTLFAVGVLHGIDKGRLRDELPLATEAMERVASRRALYVAMLLHDVAKGRGGDHSILGAKVARKLCPRLGLDAEETETVAWLVRWHLAMSDAALKRDIEDDKTIQDFADLVQSPERLRMLLVLTCADIRAVGPGRWNAWKASLMAELYHRTLDRLSGGLAAEGRERRVVAAKEALRAALVDWPLDEIDAHLERGYPSYWLGFDLDAHLRHALMIREAEAAGRGLTVETRPERERAATEVTIYAADHPGLFSRIAGAMAATGVDVVDAKISTLANGMALDVFLVQGGGKAIEDEERLRRLRQAIARTLSGDMAPAPEIARRRSALPSRTRHIPARPRVLIDNKASRAYTVIEVNGRDRPGFLYDVTRAIAALSLQIGSAKISTFGHRAVDVFYVKDVFGMKVDHEAKLAQIRDALLAAIEE